MPPIRLQGVPRTDDIMTTTYASFGMPTVSARGTTTITAMSRRMIAQAFPDIVFETEMHDKDLRPRESNFVRVFTDPELLEARARAAQLDEEMSLETDPIKKRIEEGLMIILNNQRRYFGGLKIIADGVSRLLHHDYLVKIYRVLAMGLDQNLYQEVPSEVEEMSVQDIRDALIQLKGSNNVEEAKINAGKLYFLLKQLLDK